MGAKWQKFKVQISKEYSPIERDAIAQDIIDFVVERTLKGKDKDNKKFTPGYSKEYAESRVGQVAGKRKGATPNLRLSGDMLETLGEHISHKPGQILIGFKNGSEENAKADGNVRGTYGQSTENKKLSRDFMGISNKDLKEILKSYPLTGKDAVVNRFKQILINAESRKEAMEALNTFRRKYKTYEDDFTKEFEDEF